MIPDWYDLTLRERLCNGDAHDPERANRRVVLRADGTTYLSIQRFTRLG